MTCPYPLPADELAALFDYHALSGVPDPYTRYATDPIAYSRDILGVSWTAQQCEIARALTEHSRVFVKASHNIGKTHVSGGLVSWMYDCFPRSITKTTAPTSSQVTDLTWKEVRLQRRGRNMQPRAPRIISLLPNGDYDPGHYAAGYTARDANAFQGHHEENLLIVFEEAVGIHEEFWRAADGMLSSGAGNRWLVILNPTDTSSEAYQREMSGEWHVINVSALEHPNIAAELRGHPRPYPKAIALSWIEEMIRRHAEPIHASDARAGDFAWPPRDYCDESGVVPIHYRPNPIFEGQVLGRWPSQATGSIWSEAMWLGAIRRSEDLQQAARALPPEVGCDRARFGDDSTSIHARRGPVSLSHETHVGWDTTRTLARLKELAGELGRACEIDPKEVLVKVDDFQGGVVDPARADGWRFAEVNSAARALDPEGYPNRRSELWFATASRASEGRLDFSALSTESLKELRRQLMAPRWRPDSNNRRVVEPKDATKKRIKRSPDDADALNLAYAAPPVVRRLQVI